MPKVVSNLFQIDNPLGLSINEYLGSSVEDRVSVAVMKVNQPTHMPFMENEYEEWISVLKGKIIVMDGEGKYFEAIAGQTVYVAFKEKFRTIYQEIGTEYVAICMPGFNLNRHHPEVETEVDSRVLKLLEDAKKKPTTTATSGGDDANGSVVSSDPDIIYHMCQRDVWEAAKRAGGAYFPASFVKDGYFTHATAIPQLLIETANHFYQESVGDWICLRMSRAALYHRGIIVKYEDAAPVNDKSINPKHSRVICPHIYGGIPVEGIVDAEYPMVRDGSRFVTISGL